MDEKRNIFLTEHLRVFSMYALSSSGPDVDDCSKNGKKAAEAMSLSKEGKSLTTSQWTHSGVSTSDFMNPQKCQKCLKPPQNRLPIKQLFMLLMSCHQVKTPVIHPDPAGNLAGWGGAYFWGPLYFYLPLAVRCIFGSKLPFTGLCIYS